MSKRRSVRIISYLGISAPLIFATLLRYQILKIEVSLPFSQDIIGSFVIVFYGVLFFLLIKTTANPTTISDEKTKIEKTAEKYFAKYFSQLKVYLKNFFDFVGKFVVWFFSVLIIISAFVWLVLPILTSLLTWKIAGGIVIGVLILRAFLAR